MNPSRPADRPVEAVELFIPPLPEYLQLVRAVVGATVGVGREDELPLDPGGIADLRLVVSEAVTNAIEAQWSIGANDRILVRCRPDQKQTVVEVVDRGPGFDPDLVPDLPPVEDEKRLDHESGLGLSLMKRLADGTVVETGPGGTIIRLVVEHP